MNFNSTNHSFIIIRFEKRWTIEENLRQAISVILQVIDGIHKLLDPVSNMTLKVCPGVPISIGP